MIVDGYHIKCYCAHPEHPHGWDAGGVAAEDAMETGEFGAKSRTAALRRLKKLGWKLVRRGTILDAVCPYCAKNKTPWAKLSPEQRQGGQWG